ncbi:MAG: tripartite tricarboxylate transporter substrate binding protein [Betaproteobacteria bacterium]|nr:MAG: tripartite tricarboxylate transporter substrate binding protein [Betaproteobacteria bacterium]
MPPMPASTRRRNMASQKVLVVTALVLSGLACAARAQDDYPSRPLRIVVGFTPGGGPDITARHIAQRLGESLKQQVIVENRPGAGGTVAAGMVARSPADGYTLLSVSSAHAVAAAIYPKLAYDTLKDLAGVTQTATSKYVLVAAPALGVRSVRELLAAARARPGEINFSSAGVGSGTHFAAEIFKAMAAIDVVHVPHKGIPEALGETLAGRVQFFMAPIANAVNLLRDGRLVGLGVSSRTRDALLPELPTIDEAGVAGYEQELWFGLLAPSGVPRGIMMRLNAELGRILVDSDTKARWAPIGIEPRPTAPQEFDRLVAGEIALYTRIARAANITSQ